MGLIQQSAKHAHHRIHSLDIIAARRVGQVLKNLRSRFDSPYFSNVMQRSSLQLKWAFGPFCNKHGERSSTGVERLRVH